MIEGASGSILCAGVGQAAFAICWAGVCVRECAGSPPRPTPTSNRTLPLENTGLFPAMTAGNTTMQTNNDGERRLKNRDWCQTQQSATHTYHHCCYCCCCCSQGLSRYPQTNHTLQCIEVRASKNMSSYIKVSVSFVWELHISVNVLLLDYPQYSKVQITVAQVLC